MRRVDPAARLRIIVLGYVVRGPLGGHAWHHLHYVTGLASLGHDVWFLEDSDDYPSCYNPLLDTTSTDASYGLDFARLAFVRIGLADRWAYYDAHKQVWHGPAAGAVMQICRSADIVINVSGANPLRPWLQDVGVRVFIDTDPGFTQAENIKNERAKRRVLEHTVFFTFAEQVGRGANLPDDGIYWRPTRQPVMLELWPTRPSRPDGCFTTVMVWESYPPIDVDGMQLGLKAQSFGPYLELPRRTDFTLELALGGPTAPRDQLAANGWRIRDPRMPTRTLDSYQDYIGSSLGEFAIAKHGYVVTRSGWFSERSANYLATGRPVVAQDTGFANIIPSGEGLLAFSTPEEAIHALRKVMSAYDTHRARAREIAETYFDSKVILTQLLEQSFAHSRMPR